MWGGPGAGLAATARVVSGFTGLPLARLADRVAHLVGASHDRALLTEGESRLLDLEFEQLEKALSGRSAPIVALSSVALTDPRIRALAHERGELLHLRIDLRDALQRIRDDAHKNPGRHLHLRQGGQADDEAVLARLRFLDRLCREAPSHVAVGTRLPQQVGQQIADDLEARGRGSAG